MSAISEALQSINTESIGSEVGGDHATKAQGKHNVPG